MSFNIYHIAYFATGIIWILFGCNKSEDPFESGRDYYPMEIGSYRDYEVEYIYVDCEIGLRDTQKYQLREVYESNFIDASGNQAVRIERFRRPDQTSNWTLLNVWFTNKTDQDAQKVEENVRFVKLIFPVLAGRQWDGNAMNFISDWGAQYTYQQPDTFFSAGSLTFDSTVYVLQKNAENLLEKQFYAERYARRVGLVEKIQMNFTGISSNTGTCSELLPPGASWNQIPIMDRMRKGFIYKQVIIDYGQL
jgi:hypothetical protein